MVDACAESLASYCTISNMPRQKYSVIDTLVKVAAITRKQKKRRKRNSRKPSPRKVFSKNVISGLRLVKKKTYKCLRHTVSPRTQEYNYCPSEVFLRPITLLGLLNRYEIVRSRKEDQFLLKDPMPRSHRRRRRCAGASPVFATSQRPTRHWLGRDGSQWRMQTHTKKRHRN